MYTESISSAQHQTIGIVGGMGPEAGLTLFNSILSHTPASKDQDHIPVVMISFPAYIPDRTEFLEGRITVNPAYAIAKIIKRLEATGAGIVGMACNTIYAPGIFHVLVEELDRMLCKVKLLHMPLETCYYVQTNYPRAMRVGLLSTNGTYKYGEYKNILEKQGYDVIVPDSRFQTDVIHRLIYDRQFGIKANPNKRTRRVMHLMKQAVDFFKEQQADLIILGCTELSTIMEGKKETEGMAIVSSVDALALALIREATNNQKHQPALRIEI